MGDLVKDAIRNSEREIVVSRIINASKEKVFRAFSDKDNISKWWGPKGYSTTTHEMNFKPGGTWSFTMHSPDGVDYKNIVIYTEIIKPDLINYTHSDEDHTLQFNSTIILNDLKGSTKLTLRMLFDSIEEKDKVIEGGALEGGNQTLERLDEYLNKF